MNNLHIMTKSFVAIFLFTLGISMQGMAQTAPSLNESANYQSIHNAAYTGDLKGLRNLIAQGVNIEERDKSGRTALHIATYARQQEVVKLLAEKGADMNALEYDDYDVVTIAAVDNDLSMLNLVLELGASAANVTSPYEGTALIAAAHLGHYEVVDRLLKAGAPVDHVNNLHWTALMEAVVLGNGKHNHIETVRLLVAAGADKKLADRQGVTVTQHAQRRGYDEIIELLK